MREMGIEQLSQRPAITLNKEVRYGNLTPLTRNQSRSEASLARRPSIAQSKLLGSRNDCGDSHLLSLATINRKSPVL